MQATAGRDGKHLPRGGLLRLVHRITNSPISALMWRPPKCSRTPGHAPTAAVLKIPQSVPLAVSQPTYLSPRTYSRREGGWASPETEVTWRKKARYHYQATSSAPCFRWRAHGLVWWVSHSRRSVGFARPSGHQQTEASAVKYFFGTRGYSDLHK